MHINTKLMIVLSIVETTVLTAFIALWTAFYTVPTTVGESNISVMVADYKHAIRSEEVMLQTLRDYEVNPARHIAPATYIDSMRSLCHSSAIPIGDDFALGCKALNKIKIYRTETGYAQFTPNEHPIP